ncbi:MAG TPA: hypothetical protein PLL64_14040, partial [Rhodothermales bacterium]|nr:hypothetical protein [Rhodothermales bacterium]
MYILIFLQFLGFMRYTLGSLFWVSFLTVHLAAQPDPYVSGGELLPEQAAYDVGYYDLALRIDPKQEAIKGTLTLKARTLSPLRHLVLDLDPR